MTQSHPLLQQFIDLPSLNKKILAALSLIILGFALLCFWIIYHFQQRIDAVEKQMAASQYTSALMRVYQGIIWQGLNDETAQRQFTQDAFAALIDMDHKEGKSLGIDSDTLAKRRPGVGTPLSLLHQWQQLNMTQDKSTKAMLFDDIKHQISILIRYVLDNAPPDDSEGIYYHRMQFLIDPQIPSQRSATLLKELMLDMENAGFAPFTLTTRPEKLDTVEGINHSFTFWEQLSQQSMQLLKRYRDSLLNKERQFVLGLLIAGLSLLFLAIYFLWKVYIPLRRMLETLKKFIAGDHDVHFDSKTGDEIGSIGNVFNYLSGIINQLISQLDDTGSLLKSSAKNLTVSAGKQEIASQEQEKIIRQIAVTVYDISETSKELTDTMSEINLAAGAAAALAQTGRSNLQQLEMLMQGLVGALNHLVAILTDLNERTRKITSMISVMVHVADETNMLSLNTSLEAAKAKELGKGFALIADEIRRIADQTAAATLTIENVVNEIMAMMDQSLLEVGAISDDILNSVDKASYVQRHFTEIIDKVQYLSSKFNAVTSGMKLQLRSAQAIDTSIQMLKNVTQDSGRATREVHAALGDLDRTIDKLNRAQFVIEQMQSSN